MRTGAGATTGIAGSSAALKASVRRKAPANRCQMSVEAAAMRFAIVFLVVGTEGDSGVASLCSWRRPQRGLRWCGWRFSGFPPAGRVLRRCD